MFAQQALYLMSFPSNQGHYTSFIFENILHTVYSDQSFIAPIFSQIPTSLSIQRHNFLSFSLYKSITFWYLAQKISIILHNAQPIKEANGKRTYLSFPRPLGKIVSRIGIGEHGV